MARALSIESAQLPATSASAAMMLAVVKASLDPASIALVPESVLETRRR